MPSLAQREVRGSVSSTVEPEVGPPTPARATGPRLGNAAMAQAVLGDRGVTPPCPLVGAVDGASAQARAVEEALASVPVLEGLDPAVIALVDDTVAEAARAAFGACLVTAIQAVPPPWSSQTPRDVVLDACERYCNGPGIAVLRFGEVLEQQPGGCAGDGGVAEDAVLRAVAAYEALTARSRLAYEVRTNPRITLTTVHTSGMVDQADAAENVQDVVEGSDVVHRSAYDRSAKHPPAPGGHVRLSDAVLAALDALGREFTFSVSELAGGQHSGSSRHYDGVAIDVNWIDGRRVSAANPAVPRFRARCRELGASQTFGPGDKDHDHHVHAAWPRP